MGPAPEPVDREPPQTNNGGAQVPTVGVQILAFAAVLPLDLCAKTIPGPKGRRCIMPALVDLLQAIEYFVVHYDRAIQFQRFEF